MSTYNKNTRRQQILEALARMLEASPGARITTAALACEVGVSEAALYRHFPSKAKMFEGLIEFIEDTVFSRVNLISSEEGGAFERCEKIMYLVLAFAEKNPGITRILTGDALAGETDKLRNRVVQLFDRLETQLRQILREAEIREGVKLDLSITVTVNLMMCAMEGKISQFVRSEFKRRPTESWNEQWRCLTVGLIMECA